ncbi:MAG: DUF115 domain-containing protein [Treponema sp.]|jgi:hypothetical protein|nr:DUF115 domain-containing protein [Treponema sp.]
MGQPFVKNGKTIISGIDPVRRAENTVDGISVRNRTLFFCPSPVYGYGLTKLLSRIDKEAPDSAVLCVEADTELYDLFQKNIVDSSLINKKNFCITNICDSEKLYNFINKTWGVRAFQRIEILRLTGGWQLFPQVYDSLCSTLKREITNDWSNALTLAKLGRLYIRNALRNLFLVPHFPSISDLSFGETPVLVLGAGPSLDETLDVLQKRFNKNLNNPKKRNYKIICADTCLGALKDRGIVPDLVVILESQHWNLRDFIGSSGWDIPAAIDLSSLPLTAKKLGMGFLFFTPWSPLRIFERLKKAELLPAEFAPLGSVGLTAVELARSLTKGKIICAGLDFSFTLDKYHARGTPGHRVKLFMQTRLKSILNSSSFEDSSISFVSKSGYKVHSSGIMLNYRELFEREFGHDKRLFDITGTGLPLGLNTLSYENALSLLSENENKDELQNDKFNNKKSALLKENLRLFFDSEKNRLIELKNILTGDTRADEQQLKILINECDYLWAHFPDLAGGRSPDITDLSFLKRVRTEIDPMLKLFASGEPA